MNKLVLGSWGFALLAFGCDSTKFSDDGGVDPLHAADAAVLSCGDPAAVAPVSVPLAEGCSGPVEPGSFTPVVEWQWGDSSFCGPPAVAQIVDTNGSGGIDAGDLPMIVVYQMGKVIALRGDGTGPQWTTAESSYGQDGGFAVGDVDGDGWPDVIAVSATTVCALDGRDGSELWCRGDLGASLDTYGYNYPALADMNGDGEIEVTAGNAILSGLDGMVLGVGSLGKGAAPYGGTGSSSTYGTMSVPIDLDGDGLLELVTGNAAYKPNGVTVWSNTGLDGLIAVADFDGDGQGEVVKTSGIYVTGMESDGTEVWGPLTYSGNLSAPAVDDLDGDSEPELVFAAQNELVAMEWGGDVLWTAAISDSSGASGPALFDFEMDGYPEVVFADEVSVRVFNGLDGSVKFYSGEHSSYTILELPVVADVDLDGEVEIVLGHCSSGGLTIYGDADHTWPPGRRIWNQHAYSITNVDDLGNVPTSTPVNWPTYNSFRSADIGHPPGEFHDLRAEILEVCQNECDYGEVVVAARLLNAGNLEVPAGVVLSLRAGEDGAIVATAATEDAVPSGTSSEQVILRAPADLFTDLEPVVTVDEDGSGLGTVSECFEDNNRDVWYAICLSIG